VDRTYIDMKLTDIG